MKKLLSFLFMLMLAMSINAQRMVTKFLGIPVDGTKAAMIQKLKAKGFTYNAADGWLKGEFNGEKVSIAIVTQSNKVWRICVIEDNNYNESQIKIRYNRLLNQFKDSEKYIPFGKDSQELPDDEDISYNLALNKKEYQATFLQKPEEEAFNRQVWFSIRRNYGDYFIVIYYDNIYNSSNGEDL